MVWLGTTTNFTVQGVYWSVEDCARARQDLMSTLGQDFVVVCTQDMREGRSQYRSSPGSAGLVK